VVLGVLLVIVLGTARDRADRSPVSSAAVGATAARRSVTARRPSVARPGTRSTGASVRADERGGDVDEQVLAQVRQVMAAEPDALTAARARAAGVGTPPPPEVGALLRWAVATSGAQHVIEVGAAAGVSGAWVVDALPARGVLTSIEEDPHTHALATELFEELDAGSRVRAILGRAATVLPRLSDGAYDLVLLQGRPALTTEDLDHARRLLRPGGLLLARTVLRAGEHADRVAAALTALAEDEGFSATLLPVDGGLVLATRLGPDASETSDHPAGPEPS
jgi:predicted O-methyltransferase YrrM